MADGDKGTFVSSSEDVSDDDDDNTSIPSNDERKVRHWGLLNRAQIFYNYYLGKYNNLFSVVPL